MLPIHAVVSLTAGTYVNYKMVRYLRGADRFAHGRMTAIDRLILFEQNINLLNFPVILMQATDHYKCIMFSESLC